MSRSAARSSGTALSRSATLRAEPIYPEAVELTLGRPTIRGVDLGRTGTCSPLKSSAPWAPQLSSKTNKIANMISSLLMKQRRSLLLMQDMCFLVRDGSCVLWREDRWLLLGEETDGCCC